MCTSSSQEIVSGSLGRGSPRDPLYVHTAGKSRACGALLPAKILCDGCYIDPPKVHLAKFKKGTIVLRETFASASVRIKQNILLKVGAARDWTHSE